jgi:hypothetical protein
METLSTEVNDSVTVDLHVRVRPSVRRDLKTIAARHNVPLYVVVDKALKAYVDVVNRPS